MSVVGLLFAWIGWAVVSGFLLVSYEKTIQGLLFLGVMFISLILLVGLSKESLRRDWFRKQNRRAYEMTLRQLCQIQETAAYIQSLKRKDLYPNTYAGCLQVLIRAERELLWNKQLLEQKALRGSRIVEEPWDHLTAWGKHATGNAAFLQGVSIGLAWCNQVLGPGRTRQAVRKEELRELAGRLSVSIL